MSLGGGMGSQKGCVWKRGQRRGDERARSLTGMGLRLAPSFPLIMIMPCGKEGRGESGITTNRREPWTTFSASFAVGHESPCIEAAC